MAIWKTVSRVTDRAAFGQPQEKAPEALLRGVSWARLVLLGYHRAWRGSHGLEFCFWSTRSWLESRDPLTWSCGPGHLRRCGIVIVYRISSRLFRRGNGVFCLVEAFHPQPKRHARRPVPTSEGSMVQDIEKGCKAGSLLTRDSVTNNHKKTRPGQISKKPQTRQ